MDVEFFPADNRNLTQRSLSPDAGRGADAEREGSWVIGYWGLGGYEVGSVELVYVLFRLEKN